MNSNNHNFIEKEQCFYSTDSTFYLSLTFTSIYMLLLAALIIKLRSKILKQNLKLMSLFTLFNVIKLTSSAIKTFGTQTNYYNVDSEQMWQYHARCKVDTTTGVLLSLSINAEIILIILFVIRSKDLWDYLFFEKINHLYNTNFVFDSNQKQDVQVLYKRAK